MSFSIKIPTNSTSFFNPGNRVIWASVLKRKFLFPCWLFLGSVKTTLLNRIQEEKRDPRMAGIENEFGKFQLVLPVSKGVLDVGSA